MTTNERRIAAYMRFHGYTRKEAEAAVRAKPNPTTRIKKHDPTFWAIVLHDGYLSFRTDSGYTGSTPYSALSGNTVKQKVSAFIKSVGIKRGQYEVISENPASRSTTPKAAKKRLSKKRYISRPSQAGEQRAPTARLKARRKANLSAPKGVFPNPARPIKKQPETLAGSGITIKYDSEYQEYSVHVRGKPAWTYYASDKQDALSTAQVMRNTMLGKLKSNPLKPGITARPRKGKTSVTRAMLSVDHAKSDAGPWTIAGIFPNRQLAADYAKAMANLNPRLWWRVATL